MINQPVHETGRIRVDHDVLSGARGFIISDFSPTSPETTPREGSKTFVAWSRDPAVDPSVFAFAWINADLDEEESQRIPITAVRVDVTGVNDPTGAGNSTVSYPQPGKYRLAIFGEAMASPKDALSIGNQVIKVEAAVDGMTTSVSQVSTATPATSRGGGTGSSERPSSSSLGTNVPSISGPNTNQLNTLPSSEAHPTKSGSSVTTFPSPPYSPTPVSSINPVTESQTNSPLSSSLPSVATATSKNRAGTIAGATIGAVAGIVLVLLGVLLLLQRRRRQRRSTPIRDDDPETFSRERMIKERDPTSHPASHTSHTSHTREYEAIPTIVVNHSKTNTPTAGLSVPPSRSSSMDDTTTIGDNRDSYIPPPRPGTARTDRQMQIEQKIMELHGRLITLNERARSPDSNASEPRSDTQMSETRERIEKLRGLMNGDWAREVDDEIPAEVLG
ncbi:hypothetical protein PM082_018694 [Marasmius tenuissimus]|nr:hypothetical protein PM082_018694 [Marasmius tenuissimus]